MSSLISYRLDGEINEKTPDMLNELSNWCSRNAVIKLEKVHIDNIVLVENYKFIHSEKP